MAAESALKFFKKKKKVRSTNNPFAFTTKADADRLDALRGDPDRPDTIAQTFEDAARTGLGNCDEKAKICYASLKGNPRITGSHVTLAESINYDHVFVLVTDAPVAPSVNLNTLGETAMVVDGWTEDWYFPNLSWPSAVRHGLTHGLPNPRQTYVRIQIASHLLRSYTDPNGNPYTPDDMPLGDDEEIVVRG
jgi:hypothetical protein